MYHVVYEYINIILLKLHSEIHVVPNCISYQIFVYFSSWIKDCNFKNPVISQFLGS